MDASPVSAIPIDRIRAAQRGWAARPLAERLAVVAQARRAIARGAEALAADVGRRPGRAPGETLAVEVLPLADACRFLEREAPRLLAARRLGRRGRPAWLFGVRAEVRREPCGVVLVVAPSNYPLFLPGVQVVQALAAGNAVLVKPAPGAAAPIEALSRLLAGAGLPPDLVTVLATAPEAVRSAVAAGVDKVVLTGSAETGRRVLADLAPRLVPCVMELSGNDAVIVMPGADLDLAARALAWGLRFNAGATCIAPRRVFVVRPLAAALEARLAALVSGMDAVPVDAAAQAKLERLLAEADGAGCRLLGPGPVDGRMRPLVVADARPGLGLLREDVFAPVLSLVPVEDVEAALVAAQDCPYALGAAIFGPAREAEAVAARVRAGAVTINDLIAPTADPRLPFGGSGDSGFGSTRGAEGLLELTRIRTISVVPGTFRPHYGPPGPDDAALFADLARVAHGDLPGRWRLWARVARGLLKRSRQGRGPRIERM